MIMIIGDSWSTLRPNISLESEQFYPVRSSLPQRLITYYSQPVIPLAKVGTNDLAVIESAINCAETATTDTQKKVNWVIWGWTDWTRCLPHQPRAGWPRPVPCTYTGSYQTDVDSVVKAVSERISVLEQLLPRARFLHWGAHGSVLGPCASGERHSILVDDLAHDTVGSPKNDLGLLSHFSPLDPETIWPDDSADLHRAVRERASEICKFKNKHKRAFPDQCHLAFEYYESLFMQICRII